MKQYISVTLSQAQAKMVQIALERLDTSLLSHLQCESVKLALDEVIFSIEANKKRGQHD